MTTMTARMTAAMTVQTFLNQSHDSSDGTLTRTYMRACVCACTCNVVSYVSQVSYIKYKINKTIGYLMTAVMTAKKPNVTTTVWG
jgi:hypothetical protein